MRVLFIYPNIDCPPGANHGLVSLSGVLKANGHETRMIYACDAIEPVPTHEQIAAKVREYDPGILAFSVMTQQYPWTVEVARFLRREFPNIPQVVGGVRSGAIHENDVRVAQFESRPLRFRLRSVAPMTADLPDVPPGTLVGLTAVGKLRMGDNGFMHDPRTFVAQVGAGGRFRFDGIPTDLHSARLVVAGSAGPAWPAFGAVLGRALPLPEPPDGA